MKRAKLTNLVPSRDLLRYLHCVVYNNYNHSHRSYHTNTSNNKSKQQIQRDESLSFLVDSSVSSDHHSYTSSVVREPDIGAVGESSKDIAKKTSTTDPVANRNDKDQVVRWIQRIKRSIKEKDFLDVKKCIELGQEKDYPFTSSLISKIITDATINRQFKLALTIFQKYFEPSQRLHLHTISCALESSFRLHYHEECERIYAAYMGKVQFSLKSLHIVLKSFLEDYNFILAKQFFHQLTLSGQANESTLNIYLIGVSKLAHNPTELEETLSKWAAVTNNNLSPKPYAIVLEGLMTLTNDGDEAFNRFYTNVVKKVDSVNSSIDIENIFIQRSLLKQSQQDLSMHINRLRKNNEPIQKTPFIDALKVLCYRGDANGIGFIVHQLPQYNIELDREFVNLIGTTLYKRRVDFDLLDFLGQIDDKNRAVPPRLKSETIRWVWKVLLQRYPNRGKAITSQLTYSFQPQQHEEMFPVYNKHLQSRDPRDSVIVPNTMNYNSPLAVLRRINRHNGLQQPEMGVKELENMIRRGANPISDIFATVLKGLFKCKRVTEFNRIYQLMIETGHEPTATIEVLLLRNTLEQISKDESMSNKHVRQREALNRIHQFCEQYDDNQGQKLALQDRCSLAEELANWGEYELALNMYDSLRRRDLTASADEETEEAISKKEEPRPITPSNHDWYSLSGMIRCYRQLNDLESIINLLDTLLFKSPVAISLHWEFFSQIRKAINQARFAKQYSIMYRLEERFYAVKKYRNQFVEESSKMTLQVTEKLQEIT